MSPVSIRSLVLFDAAWLDPITEPEKAVPGDQLLAAISTAYERIAAHIHETDLDAI